MNAPDGGGEARDAPKTKRGSVLHASCWLALVVVLAKAGSAGDLWPVDFVARLPMLVASSWTDVLFALGCGVLGELVLWMLRGSCRASAAVRIVFLTALAIFASYAVAAVGIFRYFNRPLTYNLLDLVGNAATMRASVLKRITGPIGVALVTAPALVFFAGRAAQGRWSRRIVLGAAVVWILAGAALHRAGWEQERREYLWLSPHVELFRSAVLRFATARRPAFPRDFPASYADEFRPFGARPSGRPSAFVLPPGVPRPRNVIVLVLESVGVNYIQLDGASSEVAPNLAAAARNGLVFTNIYAQASFTYASFRPINFSVYPGLPWHYAMLEDGRPLPIPLASIMHARGSRTGYFTNANLDWGDQRWLLERGSDFEELCGASDLDCPLLSSWGTEDHCSFDRLIAWLEEKPNESFYAVCWTDQTHDPFLLSPDVPVQDFLAGKQPKFSEDLSRYLNNLHQVDAQLGRLLARLRERGIADDTLVVITGDHGEAFADPHQQRGHAWSVYEEEVRVPLIFWNPRLFPEGQRVGTVGGHVDLNPTIADVLDVEPQAEWQGHSLFDPAHPQRAYFMAIAGGDVFGVREGNWKYIFDVTSGRESLFDLAADPREQSDKSAGEPARCLELRRRLAAWVTFEDAYLWGREN